MLKLRTAFSWSDRSESEKTANSGHLQEGGVRRHSKRRCRRGTLELNAEAFLRAAALNLAGEEGGKTSSFT